MYENVCPVILSDEAATFGIVEPLHRSSSHPEILLDLKFLKKRAVKSQFSIPLSFLETLKKAFFLAGTSTSSLVFGLRALRAL
jgi:hypothetical protein